jgi:CDGSH-type Zn-finger protein/truncated hemoglobin YjbI
MQEAPLVIEHREALVYMLAEASELEHGIMCEYLFAAFSLKQTAEEGLTPEQLTTVDGWRKELFAIAGQEMLHFALVTNVLTSLGYAPHVSRPNLPAPIHHYPAGVQLALVPFGEAALEHFLYLERPEGMQLDDAPGFTPFDETVPLMGQDDIVPSRQGFATVGHLYRSLEAGLARLVEKYGEQRIFVGPHRAQATPETFGWPELLPVTDLASAQRAIEVIVEQGEGATGDVEHSHYGRFVAMRDEYRAMRAADPGFEAARSCAPTFVRPPVDIDVDAQMLCDEPMTAAVADIFNVGYEVMLQILARYFGHGHETLEEAQVLADTAVALMRSVIQPVGQLLTRMPAYCDRPGISAGPAFELFYDSDYLLPHRRAAWLLIGERLGDLASFAGRVAEDPQAPKEIALVRDAVLRAAARLAEHLEGSAAPPVAEPAAAAISPAPLPRPHLRAVDGRTELISLLSAAAELEHGAACASLFAAASLKNDVSEGGLTDPQADQARSWKRELRSIGLAGLGRVLQLGNLLTAVGGSPQLQRPALAEPTTPGGPEAAEALAGFSSATLERLAVWARPDDVVLAPDRQNAVGGSTLGDLYYRIDSGVRGIAEALLLIGPPEAQVGPGLLDLGDPLIAVVDQASALAALAAVIGRGVARGEPDPDAAQTISGTHAAAEAHAEQSSAGFDPARRVAADPTIGAEDGALGAETARAAARLCAQSYDTMLAVMGRLFARSEETDAELRELAGIAVRLSDCVVRPLAEASARMSADLAAEPGWRAEQLFGDGEPVLVPAHRGSARVLFDERLSGLATTATKLCLTPGVPAEIKEATAALQDLACALAPADGPASVAVRLAGLAAAQAGLERQVQSSLHGPYLATNVEGLTTWLGEPIPARPQMALCRCGESASKPYCDGTHARIDFIGAKDPKRVPDRRDTHLGPELTVFDNRGICAHSGFCTDRLASVFHAGSEPFVTADGAPAGDIIRAVCACPSGALSYAVAGVEQREDVDQDRDAKIEVSKDGPYRITGGIALSDGLGNPEPRAAGSSIEHYSLCRCGHSQNKPFCSGMHWYVDFHDPRSEPDHTPTLFEWAGGFPALSRMTRLFYDKYVAADPLIGPLFAQMAPDHPERVATWLAEVFGGPTRYTDEHGGYSHMISQHLGKCLTETQRARWAALIGQSADESGLPADPEFRSAFAAYIEWGTRLAVENSQTDSHPPPNMPVPKWGWGCAGPPGGRISALAPPESDADPERVPTLPAADETVTFTQHIKILFRASDRRSMQFAFDLAAYKDVAANAEGILARLQDGSMPCDGAWPAEKIDTFARWVSTGMTQ